MVEKQSCHHDSNRQAPPETIHADKEDLSSISFSRKLRRLSAEHERYGDKAPGIQHVKVETKRSCTKNAHPDFFTHSSPHMIPGKHDLPSVLFFGGLASTGFPWKHLAKEINDKHGNPVEVYSLRGHDGCWHSLVDATAKDWVQDIIRKAEDAARMGHRPVVMGFSTGALAAISAVAQRPDLFSGLVLAGAPLTLRSRTQRCALKVLSFLERKFPRIHRLFEKLSIPLPPDPVSQHHTIRMKKDPVLYRIPLTTFHEFMKMQEQAVADLPRVSVPVLVFQGGQDKYISLDTARSFASRLGSNSVDFYPMINSPHAVMMGKERRVLVNAIRAWIQRNNDAILLEKARRRAA